MPVFTTSMLASNGISGTAVCAPTDAPAARNAAATNALNVLFMAFS